MATPQSQRIGIAIIAVVMLIGTLGSFLVMAWGVQDSASSKTDQQKQYDAYMEQQKEASKLNAANSEALAGYSTRTFNASTIKDLKVEVLVEGTGEVVKSTDSINSSYFGWLSDGTIFDSSKKKNSEDKAITFSLSQVISGWTEGLAGVKAGSIVRLTIPADKAYGANGSGIIEANSPLEFIVNIHKIDNTAA